MAHYLRRLYSYNPSAGGGGPPADGSITLAKLGGDITTAGKNLLDDADASAQRTTLGLGTAATSASSAFAAASHTHPASAISDSTAAGRALVTAADASAQRTALGLGTAATTASSAYAAASHTHAQSDITNLVSDLAGKAASVHTHTASQISDSTAAGRSVLTAADAAAQRTALGLGTAATTASTAYAAASHTHAQSDITNLVSDLAGKAASSHTHAAADIASGTIATARLGSGTANSTTFLRGDNTWAVPSGGGGGSVSVAKAFLTGTQVNSTVTPAVLTGATFTLTPGQTGTFTAILIFTAAATTTGVGAGFRVAQGAGADATAKGAWRTYTNISSSVTATGLADGDVYNVAANANTYGELLSTATTAGNNSCMATAVVTNASTNADTTVTFEFRSEVATSAVTAQIGSGVTAIIG